VFTSKEWPTGEMDWHQPAIQIVADAIRDMAKSVTRLEQRGGFVLACMGLCAAVALVIWIMT